MAGSCAGLCPQYEGKCSFYLNCYFFCTSPTNQDLREKAVYFPPRDDGLLLARSCEEAEEMIRMVVEVAGECGLYE